MALPSTTSSQPIRTQLPHLRIAKGPESGKLIWLDFKLLASKSLVLGRQPGDADIVLKSAQNRVSDRQASLHFRAEDEMLVLTNLESSEGTRLNGNFLAGPVPLVPDDVIICGDVELIFIAPTPPPPSLPPGPRLIEDNFPEIARLDLKSTTIPALKPRSFSRLTRKHPFLLGRHSSCDIKLVEEGEAGKEVSRRHAEIRWSENGYLIRPLSVNPCWVNEQVLTEAHYLREGDIIRIKSTELRFRAPRFSLVNFASGNLAAPVQNFILRYSGRRTIHLGSPNIILPRQTVITIGRARDNILCLNDPSVSRHHAEIRSSASTFIVKDLESANGTELNGVGIEEAVVLKVSDTVQIGEFKFIFEELGTGAGQAPNNHNIEPPVPLTTQLRLELDIPKPSNPLDTLDDQDQAFISADLKGYSRILTNFPDAISRSFPEYVSGVLPTLEPQPDLAALLSHLDSANPFEEILKKIGKEVLLNGNQPFLIDNPELAWFVNEGRVEIFAVQVNNGEAINSRYHICSLNPGEGFFGLDSNVYGEGLGLLAVSAVGTNLTRIPVTLIRKMTEYPVLVEPISRVLNNWLALLSTDIISGTLPSPGILTIREDTLLEIKPLEKVTPAGDNYWIKLEKGEAFFLGEEEIDATPGENYFPLYAKTWLQAYKDCTIKSYRLESILDSTAIWGGLELFYELFFRLKFVAIRLSTYDEINRLRKKAENDQAAQETALNYMASILERDEVYDEIIEDKANFNQFFKVARMVGNYYGISMVQPAVKEQEEGRQDLLGDIARFSKVRVRQVTLEPNWWKYDGGAMVGYLDDEKYPVALLPLAANRYEFYNPADNSRTEINAAVAEKLLFKAYVFYRPFPEKALKAWDLIKFGARGSRKDILITLLLAIMVSAMGLIVPLITGYLFDSVIPGSFSGQLVTIFVALLVVAYSGAVFTITRGIAILRLESKLDTSLQSAVWDRLLGLPMTFFRDYSVGDLAVRALGIDEIRTLIGSNVITAVLSNFFGLLSFVLLFFYDAPLALVALLLTIVTLALILGFSLLQLRYQKRLSAQQGRISGLVLQLISGIAKLKVAGAEVRAFKVWAKEFSYQRKLNYKARTVGNYQRVINSVLPIITVAVIFAAIGYFDNPNFSVGTYLAFMAAFIQFLTAMIVMAVALTSILQAVPLYERARPILQALPEDQSTKSNPGDLTGSIEINHVYFRYNPNGPYTLNDISVKIKPGEFVAFVGPSGAGKSSLFRLLLGFESPEQGTVYYDNQDLSGLNSQLVRRQIGVVLQNGKLMSGDIFSNIVGSSPFTLDDAWDAARMAGIEADIKDMPMGMFTLVSEGGTTLSGGQRQRLMIARAIVAKPRIILLDEATSALDNQNQALVARSLDNLKATRIVIAHRLSTIVNADRIFVMDGGKIVQAGSYAELVLVDGPFKQLVSRQLA